MTVSDNSTPRKVLMLLSNAFDPDPRVHREAKALVDAGYEVTILGWDRDRKSASQEVVDGITVERIYVDSTHGRGSSQMFFLFMFWFKAFFAGLGKSFDVVHAHDFDTLPLGFLLAKIKGRKLVYDSHESYVDMVHWLPDWYRNTIMFVENFMMKRADLVITVGDILREYLESRGANNVCVVGNWQDPEKFVFADELIAAERDRLGVQPGQKVIAFIANLGAERKIPELIEAVSSLKDCFLILGGNGASAALAQEAADTYENIVYLGYVPSSKVPFYTAVADIIFYGFDPDNPNARFSAPNKLFECLAAGKAMITGNFGEIGRIVREKECGVVLKGYDVATIKNTFSELDSKNASEYGKKSADAAVSLYCWKQAEKRLIEKYIGLPE